MSEGSVHSVEVGSFVDGPGTRLVVFLAGCPMRCQYCHNPDMWHATGETTSSEQVVAQIARTAPFLKAGGGGITLSGGEPLMQAEFALDILKGAKALGLHTALDTSGCLEERLSAEMLDALDLVLLDIKSFDETTYREVTGSDVAPTLRLARRLSDACEPLWIRFVVVPGLTDARANVAGLARFVASLSNVERVDIVPFHQMGRHKWDDLGLAYPLREAQPPTEEEMRRVRALFAAEGIAVGEEQLAPCTGDARTKEGVR